MKTIYESLSDPLKLYLGNNCLHLLSLSETTGLVGYKNRGLLSSRRDFASYVVNSDDNKANLVCIMENLVVMYLSV